MILLMRVGLRMPCTGALEEFSCGLHAVKQHQRRGIVEEQALGSGASRRIQQEGPRPRSCQHNTTLLLLHQLGCLSGTSAVQMASRCQVS